MFFRRRDKRLECARALMDVKNILSLLNLVGEDKKKLKNIRRMLEDAEYNIEVCPTEVRERVEILMSQIKDDLKKKRKPETDFAEKILEKELKKLLEI